jgi:Tol biopolymer transport system component
MALKTGKRHILDVRGEMARYLEPGYLIIARNGALLAAPFSLDDFKISQSLQLVVDNIDGDVGSGISYFDVSLSGKLVYIRGVRNQELELVWIHHDGRIESLPLPKKPYNTPRISPDGKKLAVSIGPDHTDGDIWIYDISTGGFNRLTFGQQKRNPVWSRNGRSLYYNSEVPGKSGITVKTIDGSRAENLILPSRNIPMYPMSISPDGSKLIFMHQTGLTAGDVVSLDLNGAQKLTPLFESGAFELGGMISPDGKFIAYGSNETGRVEVFINTYPDLKGKWQVSTESGISPVWAPDGKELFYYTSQGKMTSVAIQTDPVFSIGKAKELFDVTDMFLPNRPGANYDISPDGQRFVFVRNTSFNPTASNFNVILNWTEELKSRFAKAE